MRIVILGSNSPTNYSGGRYFTQIMAEALAEARHDVVYCTNHVPVFFDEFSDLPAHSRWELRASPRIRELPSEPCDLVIVIPQMGKAPYVYEQALSYARRQSARVMLLNFESPNWFNALSPEPRPESLWDGWVRVSRYSDLILSFTREGARHAEAFYRDAPQHALFRHAYPAIHTTAADSVSGVAHRRQIVCITRMGTQNRHKGAAEIAQAFCPAVAGYHFLLIVGHGGIESEVHSELQRQACRYGATLEIAYQLTDVEKFRRIRESSLMLFLSYFEGFGYPPLEAAYCGVPCIAYDLPVLREVHAEHLTFVPRGDGEALRNALGHVLADPLTSVRASKAQENVRSIATVSSFAVRLDALLAEVQSMPAPPAVLTASRGNARYWWFQTRWNDATHRLHGLVLRQRPRLQSAWSRTLQFVAIFWRPTRQAVRALRQSVRKDQASTARSKHVAWSHDAENSELEQLPLPENASGETPYRRSA